MLAEAAARDASSMMMYIPMGIGSMVTVLVATAINQLFLSDLRLTVAGVELLLIFETLLILLFGAGWFLKGVELAAKSVPASSLKRRPDA